MAEGLSVVAEWQVVLRPDTAGTFLKRVDAARKALKRLERELGAAPGKGMPDGAAVNAREELRASRRLLRSAIRAISDNPQVLTRLPRVDRPDGLAGQQDEPRAAAACAIYLRNMRGEFSAAGFCDFIRVLQGHEPLLLDELWNLPALLSFVLLESVLSGATSLLEASNPSVDAAILADLQALRAIGLADWSARIEPLIAFDDTLRNDPARSYEAMDFDSRELYRRRVAHVALHSDCSESQVAQAALDLARDGATKPSEDPRVRLRCSHVGYYLIDKGFPNLASKTGYLAPFEEKLRAFIRRYADDFFITGIQVATLLAIGIVIAMPLRHAGWAAHVATALMLVMPAMQCAVDLFNSLVTATFEPSKLPKLDLENGIPAECTTLVAVPTLLLNEAQVAELVNELEVRLLANRDPNLHYALLTDLPDSVSEPLARDSHPLVDLAVRLISDLNQKYSSPRDGAFLLLHRHRVFSVRQGVWMGWERKRGKLLDLSKLLAGEFDAFPIKAGRLTVLEKVRFVLTLDSDTQLPRGTAARLIGAIAHPLNQAVIDPQTRTVVAGYGILQPRIGVSIQSTSRSRLAAIFSGQSGFDIYTRAISDAYQDLYGEGIFTGKGIYEVATLHAVLNHRFPRNSLLSHDLIEGAYARAGLVTDTELIDDYPSHLNAYNRRKHRWVRGDWQIAQWMFPRVPDETGRMVPSPVSSLSRWQIFDNLRRSLVEPFTFLLLVAGWLGLPGGPLYWTTVSIALLLFPIVVQFGFGVGRSLIHHRPGALHETVDGSCKALFIALLNLVFLPHQTLLCLDAIFRALVRQFITGKHLLEWVSAAQAELQATSRASLTRRLIVAPLAACGLGVLIYAAHPHSHSVVVAAPVLILWGFADAMTAWLNAPPREQKKRLSATDQAFLLNHALRIWRYFRQFGGAHHNYLIPDNVEENQLFEAARVSPTNIGLLLNARQAAVTLGFLTAPEFVSLTQGSLDTIARLRKYRGHLYNWYDTRTLDPLDANPFVSSVDSGNLVASLYTLHTGALDIESQPLVGSQLFTGLSVFWQQLPGQNDRNSASAQFAWPSADASIATWIESLPALRDLLSTSAAQSANPGEDLAEDPWWRGEIECRVKAISALLSSYMPWLLPENAPLRELAELEMTQAAYSLTAGDAADFALQLTARLTAWLTATGDRPPLIPLAEKLCASLPAAHENLRNLAAALRSIAGNAERLAQETEFSFLANPDRHILSVGYDVHGEKLLESSYDMMASEARMATFLAIARGEIPLSSWNRLSREHAYAFNEFVLLSWSGTMFEYLMPSLWMRSFPDTLIARSLNAVVRVQRAYARSLGIAGGIPWGISESGHAKTDDAGHYQYHAFGIPQIALWKEASAGPVVAPYATFLALGFDSIQSLKNLRGMAASGWVGEFGFYEAADFTQANEMPRLVREWMAHHQGMSLLAILNLLHDNTAQRWFHANPLVQSAELLLHEIPLARYIQKAHLAD